MKTDQLKDFFDEERNQILEFLSTHSEDEIRNNFAENSQWIFEQIKIKYPGLSFFEAIQIEIFGKFRFEKVEKILAETAENENKLKFLIDAKTDCEMAIVKHNQFLQELKEPIKNDVLVFVDLCSKEIDRLKQIQELSKQNKKESKNPDLTLDRAVLAINYLLKLNNSDSSNTAKAEFISFITGYSKETIRQKLSTLHSKEDRNRNLWEDDMNVVRRYFQKMALNTIVEKIDKDLQS